MKVLRLMASAAACVAVSFAHAQDLIVKKDGTVIQAKVTKVGTAEVEYKKWNNQDGPQYSIAVVDILAINYKNGEKETFENIGANRNDKVDKTFTNVNTPTEETPVIASDNERLINLYNNQVLEPVKPKPKDKLAHNMFTLWGITRNSVLSDSHITVYFSKIYDEYERVSGYAMLIQNKSDETVYIDLANSFKISDNGISTPYYSNKSYTVNKSSGSGGSLNIGAVAGALGVGGKVGTLASGINVGGGANSGTTVTETEERILTIPPHSSAKLPLEKNVGKKSITEEPEYFCPQKVPVNMNLKLHEFKEICTEQNSTSIHRRIITYSTNPDFVTYKKLSIGIYLKGGLGDYWSALTYLEANPKRIKSTKWDYLLIGEKAGVKSANGVK